MCWVASGFSQTMVTTLTDTFSGSGDVEFDKHGNLFIADYGDALPNSNGTTVWQFDSVNGLVPFCDSGLLGASGNDFDRHGNLIQANIAANKISMINDQGVAANLASAGIVAPVGVAVDSSDNVYVCNCGNHRIMKIDSSGNVTTLSASSLLSCPNGMALDGDGNLYVSNFNNGLVLKIEPDGTTTQLADVPGSNNGHVEYDPVNDILYVASHGSHAIYRLTLAGELQIIAGTGQRGNQDGDVSQATFSRPNGVAISADGERIYVNSSIPVTNVGLPLNPSVVRVITLDDDTSDSTVSIPQLESEPFDMNVRYADGAFQVDVETASALNGTVYILDHQGRVIHIQRADFDTSSSQQRVPVKLSTGIYQVGFESVRNGLWRKVYVP